MDRRNSTFVEGAFYGRSSRTSAFLDAPHQFILLPLNIPEVIIRELSPTLF